jgi:hypothetical protein
VKLRNNDHFSPLPANSIGCYNAPARAAPVKAGKAAKRAGTPCATSVQKRFRAPHIGALYCCAASMP